MNHLGFSFEDDLRKYNEQVKQQQQQQQQAVNIKAYGTARD